MSELNLLWLSSCKALSHALRPAILLLAMVALFGCTGGKYSEDANASGSVDNGGNAGGTPDGTGNSVPESRDARTCFTALVQPRLEFCRSCHVAGGIADTDEGRRLLLNSNGNDDFGSVRSAWQQLGGGVAGNRLLTEPGGPSEPHSGGKPWPVGSAAYAAMETILSCFDSPETCLCGGNGVTTPVDESELPPLLGSSRGEHAWQALCASLTPAQQANTPLPADPRSLIQEGINPNRAVYFNAYWEDCHDVLEQPKSQTCADYMQNREEGEDFLLNILPSSFQTADEFNNSWQKWGLDERPADFDEMYTLRYGFNPAPYDNPYPLPGEDPSATNGGSGQLPLGLRQFKDDDGNWTGDIGNAACFQCHGGQFVDESTGTPVLGMQNLGLGNNNYDVLQVTKDGSPYANTVIDGIVPTVDQNTIFNLGVKQRGHNNAVGAFLILNAMLDLDSLGLNPNAGKFAVAAQSEEDASLPVAHPQDTPAWWNMSHRPRKFFDAGVSNESTRIVMAAGPGEISDLFSESGVVYRERIEKYDDKLGDYFLSLKSPEFPRNINNTLATQGAILFHTKNLWAEEGNEDWPQPLGGNGSCASCHGAYAPRYVQDDAYLEDARFEGMAAHISPHHVIQTDTKRADLLSPALRFGWGNTYWGYPDGNPNFVEPYPVGKTLAEESADDSSPNRPQGVCSWEQGIIGYQAPPLYGVWATAPYFHNGSVPTVEQLLDSSKRSTIWQRKLQSIGPVTGFDQRLNIAYDFGGLGWLTDVLSCEDMPGTTALNCNPSDPDEPSLSQGLENLFRTEGAFAGLLTINDPAPDAFDKRLVFDTRISGHSNQGHEFSDVLTAQERAAIIEYLKTL